MTHTSTLFFLRLKKLIFCLAHPACWKALRNGVAPSVEHRHILRTLTPDCLIDVGANRGQFSLMARLIHQELRVEAFEPLHSEQLIFRKIFDKGSNVNLHPYALGEFDSEKTLNISGQPDSSSFLPIGELQTRLFPETMRVGGRRVPIVPLDEVPEVWRNAKRALMKLDVQGFELSVLRGARQALKHCAYVYAECSHKTLYEGQPLYEEVGDFLASEGFTARQRANEHWFDGELVQADYLFLRNSP